MNDEDDEFCISVAVRPGVDYPKVEIRLSWPVGEEPDDEALAAGAGDLMGRVLTIAGGMVQ